MKFRILYPYDKQSSGSQTPQCTALARQQNELLVYRKDLEQYLLAPCTIGKPQLISYSTVRQFRHGGFTEYHHILIKGFPGGIKVEFEADTHAQELGLYTMTLTVPFATQQAEGIRMYLILGPLAHDNPIVGLLHGISSSDEQYEREIFLPKAQFPQDYRERILALAYFVGNYLESKKPLVGFCDALNAELDRILKIPSCDWSKERIHLEQKYGVTFDESTS